MKIDCPHNYSVKTKMGNVSFEFNDVNVYGEVCDHADRCGIEGCKFYDITSEGTGRFMKEMLRTESSIEGYLEDKQKTEWFRKRQEVGLTVIKGGLDHF